MTIILSYQELRFRSMAEWLSKSRPRVYNYKNYNTIKSLTEQTNENLNPKACIRLFCSTSLHLTSTRWVWTTIKLCTVHSLSSGLSLNLGNIKKFRKNLGNAENRTLGWVRRANATSVLCRPPACIRLYCENHDWLINSVIILSGSRKKWKKVTQNSDERNRSVEEGEQGDDFNGNFVGRKVRLVTEVRTVRDGVVGNQVQRRPEPGNRIQNFGHRYFFVFLIYVVFLMRATTDPRNYQLGFGNFSFDRKRFQERLRQFFVNFNKPFCF